MPSWILPKKYPCLLAWLQLLANFFLVLFLARLVQSWVIPVWVSWLTPSHPEKVRDKMLCYSSKATGQVSPNLSSLFKQIHLNNHPLFSTLRVLPFSLNHRLTKGESREKELQTKTKTQLDLSLAVWPGTRAYSSWAFRVFVCDVGIMTALDSSCQELCTHPLEETFWKGKISACVGYFSVSRT